MKAKRSTLFILAVGLSVNPAVAQNLHKIPPRQEQSQFSAEQEDVGIPIRRPVSLPDAALQVLRNDKRVALCLERENLPSGIPVRWFIASEIHLDGPDEIDLVVQPRMLRDAPAENRCLFGANIAPFWVLRKTAQAYTVVLEIDAHDLSVLNTRWKRYRNIEAYAMTAGDVHSILYRFDGQKYVPHRKEKKHIE
jgi:hypothetical protein